MTQKGDIHESNYGVAVLRYRAQAPTASRRHLCNRGSARETAWRTVVAHNPKDAAAFASLGACALQGTKIFLSVGLQALAQIRLKLPGISNRPSRIGAHSRH